MDEVYNFISENLNWYHRIRINEIPTFISHSDGTDMNEHITMYITITTILDFSSLTNAAIVSIEETGEFVEVSRNILYYIPEEMFPENVVIMKDQFVKDL